MIVRNARDLPRFDPNEMLVLDIESTSFDNETEGFNPFRGHRICGLGVGTMDGKNTWYVPMRHSQDAAENVYLPNAKRWMQDLIGSGRDIVGHLVKFDARFWHFDGCQHKGRLIDTAIMARLWKSDLFNVGLNYLTGGAKDKRVKAYLKSIRSKDWGRVPISIMGPYSNTDTRETAGLFRKFRKEMRPEVMEVWNTEVELTSHLLRSELHGIKINTHRLKTVYRDILRKMMEVQDQIDKIAGMEVDCLSNDSITEALIGQMGLQPQGLTKKKTSNQWNRATLTSLGHPIGELIKDYKHMSYFTSTFCEGWLKRMDDNNRVHTNFRQDSAKTGRMASKDPCVTNLSMEAEMFIEPDDDCAILGFDYSQIEYRIFAHYANDEKIIHEYRTDPNKDYHQMLADMMGVPRNFAKSLNFAFLYGMGKTTLLHSIAGVVAMSQDNTQMAEKLRSFGLIAGWKFAGATKDMNFDDFKAIAEGIYTTYHRRVPAVKQLTARVSRAVRARGWLRNYMGRIYNTPPNVAYKSVNLLIQGTAADIFKNRILAVLAEHPQYDMITNIYDSLYFSIPIPDLLKTYHSMRKTLEDFTMRVPLIATPCVAGKTLGASIKFKKAEELQMALKKSYTYTPEFRRKTMQTLSFVAAGESALAG